MSTFFWKSDISRPRRGINGFRINMKKPCIFNVFQHFRWEYKVSSFLRLTGIEPYENPLKSFILCGFSTSCHISCHNKNCSLQFSLTYTKTSGSVLPLSWVTYCRGIINTISGLRFTHFSYSIFFYFCNDIQQRKSQFIRFSFIPTYAGRIVD